MQPRSPVVARSRLVGLVLTAMLAGCTAAPVGTPAATGPGGSVAASMPAPPSATPIQTASPPPPPSGHIAFIRGPAVGGPEVSNQLWLLDLASGAERQLTDDQFFKSDPVWLLDGSRLAYAWYRNPDPYHDTLSTITAEGTDRRDLGPVQTIYDPPALSPDGRTVAYGGDGTEDGSSGIVLLDLASGTRRTLTRDGAGSPIWSPDGTKLLAALLSRRVLVIDAVTGATVASIADEAVQAVLGWTPDGRSVIYEGCGSTKDSCGAWSALADGTGSRPYDGPELDTNPAWTSPDGQWRAEVRDAAGTPSLFVGPKADPATTPLTKGLVVGAVSWSPDGQWLAFGASTPGVDPSARIYVIGRLGGAPIPVSAGTLDEAPAWRPVGS